MKASKQCLVVVDEYGDGFGARVREGKYCLSPEQEELLRLDKFSMLDAKEIIISINPTLMRDSELYNRLNIDKTFEVHFLLRILRNSGNICKHCIDYGYINSENSKPSTVLGYKPELVRGDVDNPSYYKESIDAIIKKADKFICIRDNKFNFSLFKEQLNERDIKLFRYDDVEHDCDKLKDFMKSDSGCLLTNHELARGTECQSLLYYQDGFSSFSMLRCTVNLVQCIPLGVVQVVPQGSGVLMMQGTPGDPAVYTQLCRLS